MSGTYHRSCPGWPCYFINSVGHVDWQPAVLLSIAPRSACLSIRCFGKSAGFCRFDSPDLKVPQWTLCGFTNYPRFFLLNSTLSCHHSQHWFHQLPAQTGAPIEKRGPFGSNLGISDASRLSSTDNLKILTSLTGTVYKHPMSTAAVSTV